MIFVMTENSVLKDDKKKKTNMVPAGALTRWKAITVLSWLLLSLVAFYLANQLTVGEEYQPEQVDIPAHWDGNAESFREIKDFVDAVSNEENPDFVQEDQRIALIDFDGCLFSETDPIPAEWKVYIYRVLEDPDYKDKATKEEVNLANHIKSAGEKRSIPDSLRKDYEAVSGNVFYGMSAQEYVDYVRAVLDRPSEGFYNVNANSEYYTPMVSMYYYLRDRGFKVYLISESNRRLMRAITEAAFWMEFDQSQIIGSDYNYTEDEFDAIGCGYANFYTGKSKIEKVIEEIGQKPILYIGHSMDDVGLMDYITIDNPHRALGAMVCLDDQYREYSDLKKAEKLATVCKVKGWVAISVKNDWMEVFGDRIKKR